MYAFSFTTSNLPSEQAKTNIIEIFKNNQLYEINDFDITVYGLDFNQKLYKFFTYGYITPTGKKNETNSF
jgi:hypothetical protein